MTPWRRTGTALALMAQCMLVMPANASSRIVIEDSSPLRATAKIDFTIVIPEVIYLDGSAQIAENLISAQAASLATPAAGPDAVPFSASGAPLAISNAGVLSYHLVEENVGNGYQSDLRRPEGPFDIPVYFLVALP